MIKNRLYFYLLGCYRAFMSASCVALACCLGFPASASAVPITSGTDTLNSPATWANPAVRTATIGWTLTFPANVSVDWTPSGGNYNPASGGLAANEGVMTITANFPDTNPINILFNQTAPGTANNPNPNPRASGLGLRFTLNSVNNNGGLIPVVDDWTSFAMKLIDPDIQPIFDNGSLDNAGLHPSFPHFHSPGTPNPFNFINGGEPSGPPSFGFLNYGGGGTVGPGGGTNAFTVNGIGAHDFEVNGLARQFTLVLQPNATFTQPEVRVVPEPSTFLLFASGVIGLVCAWRKRLT
jgi:hypothetical protein